METVIQGLQGRADGRDLDRGDKVLATAKHFVGDGGTEYGSSTTGSYTIDQGVTKVTRQQLEAVHLAPYQTAVDRGRHGHAVVLVAGRPRRRAGPGEDARPGRHDQRRAEGRMGFDGFVISDWNAIDQLPGDYASHVGTAVNAGVDMMMVPYTYKDFSTTLIDEVKAGRVSGKRIDDAVARILTQKFKLGLFEHPYADTSGADEIGSARTGPWPGRRPPSPRCCSRTRTACCR